MITPQLYATLDPAERRLWHSHIYEVKSGVLIMPSPAGTPDTVWQAAETSEMRDIIGLYGKTYHLWQPDRGDAVPLGEPQLMASFTSDGDVARVQGNGVKEFLQDRDARFGVSSEKKAKARADIEAPEKHPGMFFFINISIEVYF
jgi:hypothetical protein